jgi:hypothetical protein
MYFKDQKMEINRNNYETFFLLYLDRELSPPERQDVEKFLGENADLQKEFLLLQQTILIPAETIFEQKELLFRKEEKRRVVPLYWLRIAAAVAVLVLGSWLITMQINKMDRGGLAKSDQIKNTAPPKTSPAITARKADQETNNNPADLNKTAANKNQPGDRKTVSAQNKSSEYSMSANAGTKSQNQQAAKNHPDLQRVADNTDQQNPSLIGVANPPGLAAQKSSALELQSAEIPTGRDAKKMAGLPGMQAPVLLLASADATDPVQYKNESSKESDDQTEDAISVIALNEKNKSITGFFKKLTKRTPAADNARKVRVSVFQFSY